MVEEVKRERVETWISARRSSALASRRARSAFMRCMSVFSRLLSSVRALYFFSCPLPPTHHPLLLSPPFEAVTRRETVRRKGWVDCRGGGGEGDLGDHLLVVGAEVFDPRAQLFVRGVPALQVHEQRAVEGGEVGGEPELAARAGGHLLGKALCTLLQPA